MKVRLARRKAIVRGQARYLHILNILNILNVTPEILLINFNYCLLMQL